jgi:hypothetical protein
VLPKGAPQFSTYLDDDPLNYSYALISTSLQLLDRTDDEAADVDSDEQATRRDLAQTGFMQASYALEAATRNTAPIEGVAFHRLIAGAASHLAGFAARASAQPRPDRATYRRPALVVRGGSADEDLLDVLGPVGLLLTEHYHSTVASALFAIAYDQQDLLRAALTDLGTGEQATLEVGVPGTVTTRFSSASTMSRRPHPMAMTQ